MDDDIAILRTLNLMLKKLGMKVDTSENGSEACDKYKKSNTEGNPYDLVILDCTIPGEIGGQECTSLLQEMNPNVKVILSSGYEIEEIKKRDDFETRVFFLHKPYTINILASTLSKVLNPQVKENKE